MKMRYFLAGLLAGVVMWPAQAQRVPESVYQWQWCADHGGVIEAPLGDRTRADCLTETHAVEVGASRSWAEAIGQSLHYAHLSGRRAGVVLIIRNTGGRAHLARLRTTIAAHGLPIDVWVVGDGTGDDPGAPR